MDDGTRTHDDRNHNPGLYQLSYIHHCYCSKAATVKLSGPIFKSAERLARPTGIEPVTYGLEGRCSIQLSYGRTSKRLLRRGTTCKSGRGGGIRTHDPLLPKQMRYQTALRPDEEREYTRRFNQRQDILAC